MIRRFGRDPEEPAERSIFTRRALILGGAQAALFTALGARLYHLQVQEHNRYALLADENRISVEVLSAPRGRILDRFGDVLSANSDGYRLTVIPSAAGNLDLILRRLARLVPITEVERQRFLQQARRQSPNLPLIVAQDLTWEVLAEINLQAPFLPGVRTEEAGRRRYFNGDSMGHIVGYVGAVERRAMDDDPVLRLPWMRIGKTGIEGGMETALRGTRGSVTSEIDARGRILRHLDRTEPKPGTDVRLTIDQVLQARVLERLENFRRAAAVVMDTQTGDVLAMASVPTFDPGAVVDSADPKAWAQLQAAADDPLTNRAARGLYPPGSTFKIVTGLAALEAGTISLTERIECSGSFTYYDQTYRCWKRSGHDSSDFHKALRESCDCYFYEAARRTGIDAIARMARTLGLGQTYDAGFAQQKSGLIPDPDWKRGRFNRPWLGGETILAGIGQGYVLTTPLQLAVLTSRVASGKAVSANFIQSAGPHRVTQQAVPLDLKAEYLSALRAALTAVVHDGGGTGYRAQPETGDYKIAGKTGTSQVGRASSDTSQSDLPWDLRDHSLFVGYAPADTPKYTVAVVIEHGGGGGATAAPIARDIVDMTLDRDPIGRVARAVTPSGPAGSRAERG